MAMITRRPPDGVVFHSDRGVQYCSELISIFQKRFNIIPSMSKKGDCWDNAVVESFFSTLKQEEASRKLYNTYQEAMTCIFEFVEIFYNRKRLHSSLGYKSPIEFEEDYFSKPGVYKIG